MLSIKSIITLMLKLGFNIMLQVLDFKSFPSISVGFYSSKCKVNFFLGELSILTHGIQADYKLNFICFEWSIIISVPLFFFWLKIFTIFFLLSLNFILLGFPFSFFNFLLFLFFIYSIIVVDSIIICFLKQTRVILKFNCHVRTKLWNSIVVHFWFTNNFWHNYMLWCIFFFEFFSCWIGSIWIKSFISYTLILFQNLVN